MSFLSQTASGGSSWFQFGDLFWLSMLVLFVAAIVTAIVRLRQKDKCLKLLDSFHVTYLTTAGATMWGDLVVSSGGMELCFDTPYQTRRGLAKCSTLIFDEDIGGCLAICRSVHGLTEQERRDREAQIRVSFSPGLLRRWKRRLRNLVNTIRDACTKALGMVASQMGKTGGMGGALQTQRSGIDDLGKTLIGTMGNAYEPILERHIGRPVILELADPAGGTTPRCELPGFLVDYSERFVAVFNVEHQPVETIEIEASKSTTREGVRIELQDKKVVVACEGDDALVVRRITCGDETTDLAVSLVPGTSVRLPRVPGKPVQLQMERTRRIDIVCPRSLARIRYGSDAPASRRSGWVGAAPEMDEENDKER